MNFLLDTHALLWWLTADPRLSSVAKNAIEDPDASRYISSVTPFEIATKVRIGKLDFAREIADNFDSYVAAGAFKSLDVNTGHALLAGKMPGNHKDPFDRLLAAQCKAEKLSLITADPAFAEFGLDLVW
ncbi:type II toxin-antitoxin system VapC family toxin [Rhizobium sp. BR 362]|uniref:type II toxin-antitoxin system VapC family toxin n=1 Tax=Rhizobium sp. BR 362 TaxID=3040670 RepID=UPI002F3EC015